MRRSSPPVLTHFLRAALAVALATVALSACAADAPESTVVAVGPSYLDFGTLAGGFTAPATPTPTPTPTAEPTTLPAPTVQLEATALAQEPATAPATPAPTATTPPLTATPVAPTATPAPPTPTPETRPAGAPRLESQMVALVNALRASVGAPTLAVDPTMTTAARNWSTTLPTAFAHNPSVGGQIPGGWTAWGENVAYHGSMAAAQAALEASPGHYHNLVNPDFTHVGIGIVKQDGLVYVTQVFARY